MAVPELPVEVIRHILKLLAQNIYPYPKSCDPFSLGPIPHTAPSLDTTTSPYTDPESRVCLATSCTRVSKVFYDISIPLLWEYVNVHDCFQLQYLVLAAEERPSRNIPREDGHTVPRGHYMRRIDFVLGASDHAALVKRLLRAAPNVKCLLFWSPSTTSWMLPHARYRDGIMPFVAVHCPRLEELNLLSFAERPTLRELSLISRRCGALKTLQVYEVDTTPSASLDYVAGIESLYQVYEGVPPGDIHPFLAVQQQPHSQLSFTFPSLNTFIIGSGGSHLSITERTNAQYLVKHLVMQNVPFPLLERLEYRLPMEGMEEALVPFRSQIQSTLFHVGGDDEAPEIFDSRFTNIDTVTFILHCGVVNLPMFKSSTVRSLHVLPVDPRRRFEFYPQDFNIYHDLQLRLSLVFEELIKGIYPELELVVIWIHDIQYQDHIFPDFDVFAYKLQSKGIRLKAQEVALWRFDEANGWMNHGMS
ncbi:hypothetical protein NMY22_g8066 [Coprinellus aureogranulatus]|nr:hypothetical protein NMY22_g8066 [Coprinellus aureogranulatus]